MNKKIFVLGGDGFCGWPTSLHLSNKGYDIFIIDNLSRRKIDIDLQCDSLTPISAINDRLTTWKKLTGNEIRFIKLDIDKEYYKFKKLCEEYKPIAIIHFAEQRAAPYSMKSETEKIYTVNNNINATHNLLCALSESRINTHLIHLGTMGVYGYGMIPGMTIPEGYLKVKCNIKNKLEDLEIPFPPNPGSVYHLTKTMDALMFNFYAKNDNLRITDLHQGIVWGTSTKETDIDEKLINRFDYDSDYGTVLNRFLMQAALDYPLTVYGSGQQTRSFININNTVECLNLALESPLNNKRDKVRILNQATESHTVIDLANKISQITGCQIEKIKNPRNEASANELSFINESFKELGLRTILLKDTLMNEIFDIAKKYIHRVDKSKIKPSSFWNR